MRPNAVIDKSLLHAICELPETQLDDCFNFLLSRFVLVAPSVLIEEVWREWARINETREPVPTNLVRFLHHLQDAWIAEPLDMAFQELVEEKPVKELLKPPDYVMDSFLTLRRDDPQLQRWLAQSRDNHVRALQDRLSHHRRIFSPDEFHTLGSAGELLTDIVWPAMPRILSSPIEKMNVVEGILGEGFRYRHPGMGAEIDAAIARYTINTVHQYPVATACILTELVYFYAPLCKIRTPSGTQKILSRSKRGQYNNRSDAKYVQSALLVAGLLTRDEGMRSVMNVFSEAGEWRGETVFVDPRPNIGVAFESALREAVGGSQSPPI